MDLTLLGQHNQISRLIYDGDPKAAAEHCKRILRTFPRDITTYYLLGRVLLDLGQHRPAADLFRRVLSVDPEHVMAISGLGAIYEGRGLISEALWQMERALELSPANQEIRREVWRLREQRDMATLSRIKTSRAGLARAYLRGGLYGKAIGELRELVSVEPHRCDLRVALARTLWLDGRYVEVEAVCQGILAQLPNCLQANLLLGRVWLNSPRDSEAREMLQLVQSLDPDNRVAQILFGANSPLPPRTARLPLGDDDLPRLDLPYLESGTADARSDEAASVPSIAHDAETRSGPLAGMPALSEYGPAASYWPNDLSDGEEAVARARHLWMLGDVDRSVALLRQVLGRFPEQSQLVGKELGLLNRLHPGRIQVAEALWYAQRLRQTAPQDPPLD